MSSESSHAAHAESLLEALQKTLGTQDVGGVDALIRALGESTPTMIRRTARLLAEHGLSERAAALYEQIGDLRPALALLEQAGLAAEAGRLAEQLGDESEAEALYRQSSDPTATRPGRDPRSPAQRLGLLLLRQGRSEEAVKVLQAARWKLLEQSTPMGMLLDELEPAIAAGLSQLGLPEAGLPLLDAYRTRHPQAPLAMQDWLAAQPVTAHEPPKLLLGRYRLQKLLGAGGMGRVFRAEDVVTKQPVAIKLLPLSATGSEGSQKWQRFCTEANILRTLRHPSIVAIHDFSETAGILVMEYMRGGSLGEQPLPLPLGKAKRVLIDVTAGLVAAHAAAVLHRDLKPHNLFLDEAHNTKIGDFGAALLAQLGATQTESLVGTLAYMSPEQLDGRPLSFATDLYSLGVTLFQLLTGRLPFVGPDWVAQHLSQPAPDPRMWRPQLPAAWVTLCQQLLAKSPMERPASLEALRTLASQLPVEEQPSADSPKPGSLPSADDVLSPHLEGVSEPTLQPSGLIPTDKTPYSKTPYSELFHHLDVRLARSLTVERFAPGGFESATGVRHLHWLRTMARLGGPGLQRVLRIVLDREQPEVHYEEPVGMHPSAEAPLTAHHAAILEQTLTAIHQAAEVHGSVAGSILIEKHGPLLLIAGRGPLSWSEPAPSAHQDREALAACDAGS